MSSSPQKQENKGSSNKMQDKNIEARKKLLRLRAEEELLLKISGNHNSQKNRPSTRSSKSGQAITDGVPSESELMERRARRQSAKEHSERDSTTKDETEVSSVSFSMDHSGGFNKENHPIFDNESINATVAEPVTGDAYTEELEQEVIMQRKRIQIQQEEMTNMEIRRQSEQRLRRSSQLKLENLESEHSRARSHFKKSQWVFGAAALMVAIIVILVLFIPGDRSVSENNAAIDSPTPASFAESPSDATCQAIANGDGTYTFEFVQGVEVRITLEVSVDYGTNLDEIMPQLEKFVQEDLLPYLSGCAIDDSKRLLAQAVIGSSIRGSRRVENIADSIINFARKEPIQVDGTCTSSTEVSTCWRLSTMVKLYLDDEVGCEALVDGLTSSFTRSFEKAPIDLEGSYPSYLEELSVENCQIAITPGPTDRPSLAPITAIPTTKTPTKSPSNRPTKAPFLGTAPPTESTPRPTKSPTREPTPNPTPDPTPQPTPNPNLQPTPNQSPQPTPNPTPQPTPQPTPNPTPQPTPDPTPEPTPNPTPDPTPQRTPNPTPNPTPEPTPNPTPNPTPQPTFPPETKSPTPPPTPETPETRPPTPKPTPQGWFTPSPTRQNK